MTFLHSFVTTVSSYATIVTLIDRNRLERGFDGPVWKGDKAGLGLIFANITLRFSMLDIVLS